MYNKVFYAGVFFTLRHCHPRLMFVNEVTALQIGVLAILGQKWLTETNALAFYTQILINYSSKTFLELAQGEKRLIDKRQGSFSQNFFQVVQKLHYFLCNLCMGPLSYSVTSQEGEKASQEQTIQLTGPIQKLRRKRSVVNKTLDAGVQFFICYAEHQQSVNG